MTPRCSRLFLVLALATASQAQAETFSLFFGLVKRESRAWTEQTRMTETNTPGQIADIQVETVLMPVDPRAAHPGDRLFTREIFNIHPFWQAEQDRTLDAQRRLLASSSQQRVLYVLAEHEQTQTAEPERMRTRSSWRVLGRLFRLSRDSAEGLRKLDILFIPCVRH